MGEREEQLSLARKAARLYYHDQKTQEEIAQKLGCSRAKVVRLLKLAQKTKLIEFYIPPGDPKDVDEERADKLKEELVTLFPQLKESYTKILPTFSIGEILLEKLGKMGAGVLEEIVDEVYKRKLADSGTDHEVKLGVGFGTQLRHVVNYSYPRKLYHSLYVIPLVGGLGPEQEFISFESNELARRIAKHYRGRWYHLLAPARVPDKKVKATIEGLTDIFNLIHAARHADIYLVGIGGTNPKTSAKIKAGLITHNELKRMESEKGVVGTICARMFTRTQFLFRIDKQFQNHLAYNKVSDELRQEFENNGLSVSDCATISTEVKDSRWSIRDSDQTFSIRREMHQINIYSPSKSCPHPNGEIIGITLDDLKKSMKTGTYVLGVAGDADKYEAILGALEGGYINALVTEIRCADWIIKTKRGEIEANHLPMKQIGFGKFS